MTPISKLTERFTETEIDDEIIVMRLDTGQLYSLSGTAAAIWRLIDGTRDRTGLIDSLADEYEGDKQVIRKDVDEILARLREIGLVGAA